MATGGQDRKIAVVGDDVTALSAAYNLCLLKKYKTEVDFLWTGPDPEQPSPTRGQDHADTIVYSPKSHPMFAGFLRELSIEGKPTDFDYKLNNGYQRIQVPRTLYALLSALVSAPIATISFLWTLWLFCRDAWRYLAPENRNQVSLSLWLRARGYNESFTRGYLCPVVATFYGVSGDSALAMPAEQVLQALASAGFTSVCPRPWHRVSRRLIMEAVAQKLRSPTSPVKLHVGSAPKRMNQTPEGKWTLDDKTYDNVIISVNDQNILKMEAEVSDEEAKKMWAEVKGLKEERNSLMDDIKSTGKSNGLLNSYSNTTGVPSEGTLDLHDVTLQTKGSAPSDYIGVNDDKTEQTFELPEGRSGLAVYADISPFETLENAYTFGWKAACFSVEPVQKHFRTGVKPLFADDVNPAGMGMFFVEKILSWIVLWLMGRSLDEVSMTMMFSRLPPLVWGRPGIPGVVITVHNPLSFVAAAVIQNDQGWTDGALDSSIIVSRDGLFAIYLAHTWTKRRGILRSLLSYRRDLRDGLLLDDYASEFITYVLDDTKTFSTPMVENPGVTLEEAQTRKNNRIVELIEATKDFEVLEIGAGWGTLSCMIANKIGCKVTAVTTSPPEPVAKMISDNKCEHLVTAFHYDMMEIPQRMPGKMFDAIVMVEVVEEDRQRASHMSPYIKTLASHLKPGGRLVIQLAMCRDSKGLPETSVTTYPGEPLLSLGQTAEICGSHGLYLSYLQDIKESYMALSAYWTRNFVTRTLVAPNYELGPEYRRQFSKFCQQTAGMAAAGVILECQTVWTKPDLYFRPDITF